MVAFLFLFAPVVVLIAVWIMQRFQPKRDAYPPTPVARVFDEDRIEPRFGAVNDNIRRASSRGTSPDRQSIPTR
jgi:hypothetical protein